MQKRPNLILIMTDQQRFDTIAELGAHHMHTPNLDQLARRAVRFRNAFCPGATCVASRAAIFTGLYPHNSGAYSFANWGHHRTWIHELADAGYWCVNIGKMHFQPRDVSGGFHERTIVENPTSVSWWGGNGDDAWGRHLAYFGESRPNGRHRTDPGWTQRYQCIPWHLGSHLHSDVFIGDSAVSWIQQWQGDQPVFLQVGFTGPHEPWDPLPEHLSWYENVEIPDPMAFPEDLSGKPPQQETLKRFHSEVDHESRIAMQNASLSDIRTIRRHYFAKITLIDQQIGRVIEALSEASLLDNSLIVVCSDHGEMLGEHGMAYKWLMYDDVVRVPLLLVPTNVDSSALPKDEYDLVSLIDLGPTFLEAAGIPLPSRLEGKSVLGALSAKGLQDTSEFVFCEDNYLVMGRSKSTKIIVYLGQEEGELYDLSKDPNEMINLWNDPPSKALRDSLRLMVLEWLAKSVYFSAPYRCNQEGLFMRWPTRGNFSLHGSQREIT